MIRSQIPAGPILVDAEPVLYPQMPAQDFGAKPAFETHDVMGPYRLSDRHRRLAWLRHWRGGLPKAGECTMDGDDQFNKLLGSELMMSHIAADNARDLVEIAAECRILSGHLYAP